jgi:integrase
VAFLASESIRHTTIVSYLSAFRYAQISAGLPDPSSSSLPRLTYVMQGARHASPPPRSRRLPVTPEILRAIADLWSNHPPSFDSVMLWAAFCLRFFGFMRAGECTCPSLHQFDPSSMLSANDITIDSRVNPRTLTVLLKMSKCDPFGTGVRIYLGRTHQLLCPVAALLAYLAIRPSSPGPLFIFQDGSPLTREKLRLALAEVLTAAGINASGYTGHSFRIGAATTAARAGLSDSLIQSLGRWKSSTFTLYIRSPSTLLATASTSMAS